MFETGNITDKGQVTASKVHGRNKLMRTSQTVVLFATGIEDFAAEDINEGHRPSICKKDACLEGAHSLIQALGMSCGTDAMILLERLLRGIAEAPEDPYFLVKEWLALGYDRFTQVAYEQLRSGLRKLTFPSNNNLSLSEQFEMPSFDELTGELSRKFYQAA